MNASCRIIRAMLEFQKQDCDLTLQEGLGCYYLSFSDSAEIIEDGEESGNLLRNHDCTHVIFGLDTSIEQESILDSWVLWGSSYEWSYLMKYRKIPEIKELTQKLIKEFGITGFLKLYWRVASAKRKVIFRTFKMNEKWPFKVPEEYLTMKIYDLREKHGIKILLPEEMRYTPVERLG